ncbi:Kojibiose phosphorylase [bacterium BMS3Bbin08]|nr:Kojibiose phosphorylase [bacterium BMS3Bbin08]
MEDYFGNYLSDAQWQIFESGWDSELQNVHETIFALGNGYVGSRAILEENPPGCRPGTFFSGIYEGTRSLVPELVNAPNPLDFRISVEGEKLGVKAMRVLKHKRILDMRKGILARHTIYSNARKKRFNYQSMRFFSMHDKNTAVMQVYLNPLDKDATFTITATVDTSIMNVGLITEGRKRHVTVIEAAQFGNIHYLCTKSIEKGTLIAYANQIVIKKGKRTYSVPGRAFDLHLKKGESACITNYISCHVSGSSSMEKIKKNAKTSVARGVKKGFDKLYREHCRAWEKKWKRADIEIYGVPNIERAVRFNIYHLLIAVDEKCHDVSVGAKALTGEGYRGHIFWDTELFCLPFYLHTNPAVARNLLLYRYNRLDAARKIAKQKGYQGAMFPWESADTGEETTPSWYKDSSGRIQKVLTGGQECHITADIAYAVIHYFSVTDDTNFLLDHGLEIILETARFWASRVEYNSRKKRYEISKVIGPDEFHENVKNNAYTNLLVQWNLNTAAKFCRDFQKKYPANVKKLMSRINLLPSEIAKWKRIAAAIYIPVSKKTKIVEQFEGFFKKRKLPLTGLDHHSLPLYPGNIRNIGNTQYVKQSDVVMALFLLSEIFSLETKRKNYLYYEKRTLHKSSLSASIHAAVGAEVGEEYKACHYFEIAAYADLKNVYGNTNAGIHAASLGGVWQALIHGFAGLRIRKGMLCINPQLPSHWKGLKTSVKFRGFDISVVIGKEKINLYFSSKVKKDRLTVSVYGIAKTLLANRRYSFFPKHKKIVPCGLEEYY